MKIELIGPGYIGRSSNIDASRSVNFMPEMHAPGAKTKMSLVSTPGTSIWLPSGIVLPSVPRGFRVCKNPSMGNAEYLYVVAANNLLVYDITGTLRQQILGAFDSTQGPVLMKDNGSTFSGVGGNQIMITDLFKGYIYNTNTQAFTKSTSFTGGGWPGVVNALEYVDGYFVVSAANSMNAYASDLYNGINWNSLAIAPIQAAPDTVQAIWNVQEQLYFIKQYTTEIFYNNSIATSQGFPFSRMTAAVLDTGCGLAGGSVARQGETLYMLGFKRVNDTYNFYGVVAVKSGNPTVISPQSITYQMQNWAPWYDIISYCYEQDGHSFYVVTSPTANQTFVFDASIPDPLSAWHERSSYVGLAPYQVNRHLSNCYASFGGKHLVGDYLTPNIYQLVPDTIERNGTIQLPALPRGDGQQTTAYPIVSVRTFQILADKEVMGQTIRINRLVVDAESGGPYAGNPSATLSFSDDGGHTFKGDYPANISKIGRYGARMVWRRVGTYPYGIIPRITISDIVKRVLINAYID
jgi:hypothetical protein